MLLPARVERSESGGALVIDTDNLYEITLYSLVIYCYYYYYYPGNVINLLDNGICFPSSFGQPLNKLSSMSERYNNEVVFL